MAVSFCYISLQACVTNKDLKLALHLFDEMKTHQLKPNLVSLSRIYGTNFEGLIYLE